MSEQFTAFFDTVKNGTFGFEQIFAYIAELWASILANEHIVGVTEWINTTLAAVLPFLPYILLGVYAILLLFGKRLFSLVRFIAFFLAGFVLGVYYLAPIVIGYFASIPAFVVGIVVGLLAAVLGKLLYYVAYSVAVGYSVYLLCVSGMVIAEIAGNYLVGAIVAGIALVLALVLHNIIERLGTAFLGAYGILGIVKGWYDFTTLVPGYEWAVMLGATAVLALIGFAVQQATRKKKY